MTVLSLPGDPATTTTIATTYYSCNTVSMTAATLATSATLEAPLPPAFPDPTKYYEVGLGLFGWAWNSYPTANVLIPCRPSGDVARHVNLMVVEPKPRASQKRSLWNLSGAKLLVLRGLGFSGLGFRGSGFRVWPNSLGCKLLSAQVRGCFTLCVCRRASF